MGLCSKCHLNPSRVDHSWCQLCLNEKRRVYYQEHRAEQIQTAKDYFKKHPDKKKAYAKKHYNKHKDRRQADCRAYAETHPAKVLMGNARRRARVKGVPFAIKESDIIIPDRCPVFGTEWRPKGEGLGPNSMTLDRIRPELGYVPGNIAVISHRANTTKSSLGLNELQQVIKWLESVL